MEPDVKRAYEAAAAFTGPLLIIMVSSSCGFVIGATFRL